jgi:c-di-GMP-binding flagellar brake protein YcgR
VEVSVSEEPVAEAPQEPPVVEERRVAYRLNKVLGAEIVHGEEHIQARLFVIDISTTGFRATNQFALPAEVDLSVSIVLKSNSEPVKTAARIVWMKELTVSGLFQFGFEFRDIRPEDQQRIEAFIEEERELARKPKEQVYLGRAWTTIKYE